MSGRTGVRKDPSSLAMRALIINPGFGLWQPQGVQTAKRCGVPLRPHDKRIHAPSETSLVRTHISLGLSPSVLLDSARVKNLKTQNSPRHLTDLHTLSLWMRPHRVVAESR